jgi:hypothetical protein
MYIDWRLGHGDSDTGILELRAGEAWPKERKKPCRWKQSKPLAEHDNAHNRTQHRWEFRAIMGVAARSIGSILDAVLPGNLLSGASSTLLLSLLPGMAGAAKGDGDPCFAP